MLEIASFIESLVSSLLSFSTGLTGDNWISLFLIKVEFRGGTGEIVLFPWSPQSYLSFTFATSIFESLQTGDLLILIIFSILNLSIDAGMIYSRNWSLHNNNKHFDL